MISRDEKKSPSTAKPGRQAAGDQEGQLSGDQEARLIYGFLRAKGKFIYERLRTSGQLNYGQRCYYYHCSLFDRRRLLPGGRFLF